MHAADLFLAVTATSLGLLGFPGVQSAAVSGSSPRDLGLGDLGSAADETLSSVGTVVGGLLGGAPSPASSPQAKSPPAGPAPANYPPGSPAPANHPPASPPPASPAPAKGPSYTPPGPVDSEACRKDVCCVYSYALKEAAPSLVNYTMYGECQINDRAVVRLGFHDAAAWNTSLDYGGADGSIILAEGEINRPENVDLQAAAAQVKALYDKYHPHGLGAADMIQLLAIAVPGWCAGGARGTFMAGRKDSDRPAAEGLLPSSQLVAEDMVKFFAAKGFNADELVALTGAHTASRQRAFDPTHPMDSQDSTPGTFDNLYYKEMLAPNPAQGVTRFPSDLSLSKGKETEAKWKEFAADGAQEKFTKAYTAAYLKLSLLGVKDTKLTDCTAILPW